MTEQSDRPTGEQDSRTSALSKRLDAIGWGLFLIMVGGILLVPEEKVPEGAWIAGVGLILLGTNGARFVLGLRPSGFFVVLGVLALAAGVSDYLGVELPIFPILLVLVGLSIILGPVFRKKGV